MADFSLIKEHKLATVGIVGGGGLLVFLVLRNRSANAAAATQQSPSGLVYSGTDPNALAAQEQLAAQQAQVQAQLQGLTISGQTQMGLAQIGAGVSLADIAATKDTTNTQTAAQLQLGLGTLNAQTQQTALAAQVQLATIDALVRAFGGSPSNPAVNPTPSQVQNPIYQVSGTNPPVTPVYIPPVVQSPVNNNPPLSNPLVSDPGAILNSGNLTTCTATNCPGPYSNPQFNYDAWLQQNQAWGTGPAPTANPTGQPCGIDPNRPCLSQTFLAPVNLFPPPGQQVQNNLQPYAHH